MKIMKQIAVLLLFLVFSSLAFAQSSSLQEGNSCFANGDYACAIEKYKDALRSPDERQKKIAGDNLMQAEKCFELRRMADAAFNSKNFIKAKEYYLSLINENSKDEYAKAQLNEIKIALITLSVSKNSILFSSSGGKENIIVTTEADSYSVGILPSWCSVQKNGKHLLITCTENASDTERTGNLILSAGSKTHSIGIRQSGKQAVSTLSVSKEKLSFTSAGGKSGKISVNTNALYFSISLVPSWCSVQSFNGHFIITCSSNNSTQSRFDWFKVTAGNNEVKVYVTQEGNNSLIVTKTSNTAVTKTIKEKYFFMNAGAVANDPGKIETLMVTIGSKRIYVRLKFNPSEFGKDDGYSTNFLSSELEINNSGKVQNFPSSTGYYYVVNDQMVNNRQSATLGANFGGKTLRFYLGGGYGERANFWGLNLNTYSGSQNDVKRVWAKNINQSWKGIEAEGGLFLKLGHFNILGGTSVIFDSKQTAPYIDLHFGIGFSTR